MHSPEMKELAGPVLLTESREEAAAFAGRGGCVIGLCPEDALRTIDFPEAYVLASLEAGALSEAFIRRTACHFYRVPFTVAETDRLIIRESVAEDWNVVYDLLRACTEGSRSRILAEGFDLHEIDTSEKFVRYVDACYHFLGFGVWTVLLKEKNKVIGWCGLFPKKDVDETGFHVELGYVIAPDQRGKGYAYEACSAILSYARDEMEVEEVLLKTDADNAASVSLAKKLGFTECSSPAPDNLPRRSPR